MQTRDWLLGLGLLSALSGACGGEGEPAASTPSMTAADGNAGMGSEARNASAAIKETKTDMPMPGAEPAPMSAEPTPEEPPPMPPEAPPAMDPGCLTEGSDGPAENLEDQVFTDSDGRTSQYHLLAAHIPQAEPAGLLIYFHGDGGYEFDNHESQFRGLQKHVEAHRLLFLIPLTPDREGGEPNWWMNDKDNVVWLRELLDKEVFAKYNVNRQRVLVVGTSGGSEFIAYTLVPDHSDLMCGGGAVVLAGGTPPWGGRPPTFAPGFVDAFKLHFYTGLDDTGCSDCACDGWDALAASNKGADYFRDLGFSVSEEHPEGIGHCEVPTVAVIGEQLDAGILPAP